MSAMDRVAQFLEARRDHTDDLVHDLVALAPASISQSQRDEWKAKGWTLSDGSFPIPTEGFLKRAMQSFGRCPPDKRAALKALISRRAKDLGVDISGSSLVAASAPAFGGKKANPFGKKDVPTPGDKVDDPEDLKDGGADEAKEAGALPPPVKAKYDALRKRGMNHSLAMKAAKS